MPLVWALRALGHREATRVYGPELMIRFCAPGGGLGHAHLPVRGPHAGGARAAASSRLHERFPGLRDRGRLLASVPRADAPPSRTRSPQSINSCGAQVVWVGIGQPKQERWMAMMRPRLQAPLLVGVGAAFDFHAGLVSAGAGVDAAQRPRVGLPAVAGAPPAVASLRPLQPAVRGRLRASIPRTRPVTASRRAPLVFLPLDGSFQQQR